MLWWRDNEIKEWLRVEGEKKHFKSLTIRERGGARQEELWWRDNEIKEWLRVEGEKKHFNSLTIRERGEGNLVMQKRGKGDVVRGFKVDI